MPSFGATGQAPDFAAFEGRGWEPVRTWHTPRADRSRSAKSSSGGRQNVADAPASTTAARHLRSAGWDGSGAYSDRSAVRPDITQIPLRSHYETALRRGAPLPGPANLGDGPAHSGYDPRRHQIRQQDMDSISARRYGTAAPRGYVDKGYSTKKEPPMPPMPARDSTLPWLMNGKVVAGGRLPPTPDHHRPGYQSPDRALVGDEERTALAAALKRMGK